MKKCLVVIVLMFPSLAAAQEPQSFSITLTPAQVEQVYAIISERPYKEVSQVLETLRAQVMMQRQNASKAPPATPPETPPAK